MFQTCCNDVQRNLRFNNAMYYNFFVPSCLQHDGRLEQSTFCSEYVCSLLQQLQLRGFESMTPHRTDPLTLYQQVLDCGHYKKRKLSKEKLNRVWEDGGLRV